MASKMYITIQCFIYVCINICQSSRLDMKVHNSNDYDFDVKPGGQIQSYEQTLDDITCKFTYACQGGTKEKWSFNIVKTKDESEYACSVERPSGVSYLFFETFELELLGVTTKEAIVIGENGQSLTPSEYTHKKHESKVVWEKDFGSHLTKVELYGTVGKKEL